MTTAVKAILAGLLLSIFSMSANADWRYVENIDFFITDIGIDTSFVYGSDYNDEVWMIFQCKSYTEMKVGVSHNKSSRYYFAKGVVFGTPPPVRVLLHINGGDVYNEILTLANSSYDERWEEEPFSNSMRRIIGEIMTSGDEWLNVRTVDTDGEELNARINLHLAEEEIQKLSCFRNSGL
ncbi:MAG: hypothetical protein ACR2PR_06095 [Pseudohongiellaceae bacterium]